MPVHVTRYSLAIHMTDDEIEHETVDTSKFLGYLPIVCQVTPSISPFSDCLEFFFEFLQTSVSPNNIIPLEVFVLLETQISHFCTCKSFT